MKKIRGRVWKFSDNVDTDQIIPAEYLVTSDKKELAKHVFEKVRPEFAKEVREGDIIVADDNFGCGSSREHAPLALLGAGISAVIAKSFARIFFRNAINIGLPVIECKEIQAEDNDILEIDFHAGKIKNLSKGKEYEFKPLPDFLRDLLEQGGLVSYVKKKMSGNDA
ncbi:MAG TPA: 3-isopropylmalate dehydratase small subunit [Candidatus Altiarchaeales archaeon]|nr:3-isopropylmalate dehydratase small subunit [Candidatus Altiarchaeales archaeon]